MIDSEIKDRVRRIESRVTRMMIHMGVPTGAQPVEFRDDELHVPTPAVSLKSCLEAIPEVRRGGTIRVKCNGEFICVLAPKV